MEILHTISNNNNLIFTVNILFCQLIKFSYISEQIFINNIYTNTDHNYDKKV